MVADVMSMSTFGRITDPVKKMDMLLGYFYASDYSQSNEFLGKIQSLSHIIQDVGKNTQQIPARVESAVRTLFLGYFDDVIVKASLETIPEEDNSYRLTITIDATIGVQTYNASDIAEIRNSTLMKYPNSYV